MNKIKEGDVYRFRWSPKKEQGWDSRQHCFQGMLIAKKNHSGDLVLRDTYWSYGNDTQCGKVFTEEEIRDEVKKGAHFEFFFNLDDVEPIDRMEVKYMADEDVFYIAEQNACDPSCIKHFKRKGAVRHKETMLTNINDQIAKKKRDIEWAAREIENLAERRTKIEAGDLTQYL